MNLYGDPPSDPWGSERRCRRCDALMVFNPLTLQFECTQSHEKLTIYEQNGHTDRTAYLESLAESYGVSFAAVKTAADILGEIEDFDSLITHLEDGEIVDREEEDLD